MGSPYTLWVHRKKKEKQIPKAILRNISHGQHPGRPLEETGPCPPWLHTVSFPVRITFFYLHISLYLIFILSLEYCCSNWSLNNMDLRSVGLLLCGFFPINTIQKCIFSSCWFSKKLTFSLVSLFEEFSVYDTHTIQNTLINHWCCQ